MSHERTTSLHRAVIIGGGFSGLATAALLGKAGWEVTLLEKNSTLGGRARTLEKNKFSFDMGPSWYLMPEVFERYFAEFNKKPEDFYQLIRLNPRYRVHYGDGDSVTLSDDIADNAKWFEQQESGAGKKLHRFLRHTERIYDLATQDLMYTTLDSAKTWRSPRYIRAMLQLAPRISWLDSWHQEVARFFTSPKLQKILEFPAVFLGGSPYMTPSLYAILAWADFGKGVWYPRGGMKQVVSALASLAQQNGAHIHTEREVTRIAVENGAVTGVFTGDTFWPAEVVIGATDVPHVENALLPKQYQTITAADWQKKSFGISALVIYLGLNKKLKNVIHHELYFADDWQRNFAEIFEQQTLPKDPSFYMSVRTATDDSIAPKDSEELFILVPLGTGTGVSAKKLSQYADTIIGKVEQLVDEPLREDIVVQELFGPQDFAAAYNAYQGTALGLAHTPMQSLWGRPAHQHAAVSGLYFAGQYTQPGVGVPMALISAQMVAEKIQTQYPIQKSIFRKGSVTYFYTSRFFPPKVFTEISTLYAYVRVVDDIIDTSKYNKKQFAVLWEQTQQAWSGEVVANGVVRNFIQLAQKYDFEWEWIEAFWDSMRQDQTKSHYNTYQELEDYMYGSAEVIGLMMARILQLPKKADLAARLQGRAMQFVNFIRDVGEDVHLDRNYLGYSPEIAKDPEQWAAFIREQIHRYCELQAKAEKGYQYIPRQYLIPIKTAADMYTWTARKIYRDPSIVWRRQLKPRPWYVMFTLLKNQWELRHHAQ